MASLGKLTAFGTAGTLLASELNSLGNGSMSGASGSGTGALYDNASNLFLKAYIEVNLASFTPAAGGYVNLYIAIRGDSSNFPAPAAADLRAQTSMLIASIPVGTTAATAQRIVLADAIDLPSEQFKFYLDNQSGGALNATGNTVKIFPFNYNLNG